MVYLEKQYNKSKIVNESFQATLIRIEFSSPLESKKLNKSLLSMHLWAAQYSKGPQSAFVLQVSQLSNYGSLNIKVHNPFIHS